MSITEKLDKAIEHVLDQCARERDAESIQQLANAVHMLAGCRWQLQPGALSPAAGLAISSSAALDNA